MCIYNEKYFTNYVDTYVEYEEENEEVSHLGLRTDNESICESKMSTF